MYKELLKRLDRLEANNPAVEGDYIIVTRKDGSEEQLYYVDALKAVLDDEITAVRAGKLQNGEGLGLCEAMLMSKGDDDETD